MDEIVITVVDEGEHGRATKTITLPKGATLYELMVKQLGNPSKSVRIVQAGFEDTQAELVEANTWMYMNLVSGDKVLLTPTVVAG